MLDFTKEIKLKPHLRKKYLIARTFLYLTFIVGVFFVADRILFPSISLMFSFGSVNSLKNTLVSPRTSEASTAKDAASAKGAFTFNANPSGHFSDAKVAFSFENHPGSLEGNVLNIRKSYQAFFYPEGAPVGFKNGTLLSSNGEYFIISSNYARKFSDSGTLTKMGFSKNAFLEINKEDLRYNKFGEDISDPEDYPDDALFVISETYYQLKNKTLFPFVSTRAFLSQFEAIQAIEKNNDFFEHYPASETSLGFADGTLGSSDISVFILSEGKSYPIMNAETFVEMGFDWNKVIKMDSEELGLYERQKQFTHNQPHPDGTLFLDKKTNKFFVIKNKERHPIESSAIEKTYAKQTPIVADLEESKISIPCMLEKNIFRSDSYSCTASLDALSLLIGNDYQIETEFPEQVELNNIDMTFFTQFSWKNFMLSLSNIKTRLINNYIPQQ